MTNDFKKLSEIVCDNNIGNSSKTLLSWIVDCKLDIEASTPVDFYDFGRVYTLINTFPFIKKEFHNIVKKYPDWKPIVDNFDVLEKLYLRGNIGFHKKLSYFYE